MLGQNEEPTSLLGDEVVSHAKTAQVPATQGQETEEADQQSIAMQDGGFEARTLLGPRHQIETELEELIAELQMAL